MRSQRPMPWMSVVAFAGTALVGPLLWQCVLHFEDVIPRRILDLVDSLLFFVWPGRLLVMGTDGTAPLETAVVACGTNVALFIALGLLAEVTARWRGVTLALYAWLALCLMLLALLLGDSGLTDVPWLALVTALIIYALPFLLLRQRY